MASIFKPAGKTKYTILFFDANGRRRKKVGTTDKVVTERIARDLENKVALRREGLVDPKAEAYRDHEARPLADHIADWQADLIAKGHTSKHAGQSADRVRRLVAVMFGALPGAIDCKLLSRSQQEEARQQIARLVRKAQLSNVTTERVQSALARFREAGRSAQTCNHYRAGVLAFARWAWKTGRLRETPLVGVTGYNAREDRRHDRRTLALDELRRLIDAAQNGPQLQKMSGPVRALCYRLAASTGLRYSEIASIVPESFVWERPGVVVEAAYTKNGQVAELPLPADLAEDLRRYTATLAPGSAVFPLPTKGAAMIRRDLEAAGIPYRDESGLVFDFHALRCEMATLADRAGISPRVVQRLMRHSSLELTGRYTRPRAVDIESAASLLPSLKPEADQPESAVMTGTDPSPFARPTTAPLQTDTLAVVDGCNPNASKPTASIQLRSDRPKHRTASLRASVSSDRRSLAKTKNSPSDQREAVVPIAA
jgi:integrase